MSNSEKLKQLAGIEGYSDVMDLLEMNSIDSVVPGICRNCDYTTEVEPDCRTGYCENCETQTVVSCLVLAGII